MGWLNILIPISIIGLIVNFIVWRGFQMKALAHEGVAIEGSVIEKFRQTGSGTVRPLHISATNT